MKIKNFCSQKVYGIFGASKGSTTDKSCYFLLKMLSNLYNLDHSLCTDHNKNSLTWSKSSNLGCLHIGSQDTYYMQSFPWMFLKQGWQRLEYTVSGRTFGAMCTNKSVHRDFDLTKRWNKKRWKTKIMTNDIVYILAQISFVWIKQKSTERDRKR